MTSTQQKMDDAAEEARLQLGLLDQNAVLLIAVWIKKNYLTAGYKRLCKVMMQEVGVK